MNEEQQRHFTKNAKQLLDEAATHLDGETLSRLQRARNRALTARSKPLSLFRRPLPLTGMIASAITATALVLFVAFGPVRQDAIEKNLVADLGLLTAEESLEFFEDIEFYEWLSTVEGEDNGISRAHGDTPDLHLWRPGLERNTEDRGREAGVGDAGVSRII
jgi:hypothetical protein